MLRVLRTTVLWIALICLAVEVSCIDNYSRDDFPADFIFGASTSAYQVEGAASDDGRTPSIWDTFTHKGGLHGDTGDVAADEYHKYKEDVRLMVDTGLDAYRFSISWPRLIPNGRGPVNRKGLEYYNNLINELVSHGIEPHITLFHYDLPQALEDEYGGWLSRKIVKDFAAYADVCFKEFGDRVSHWSTLNEPNIFVLVSYDMGILPPNRCSPPFGWFNCSAGNSSYEPYLAAHNLLLSHAAAVRLYRKKYQDKQQGLMGISLYTPAFVPLTNSTEDKIAAQRFFDYSVGLILNPIVYGDYPDVVKRNAGKRLPTFTSDESKQLKDSFDFFGLIHYNTYYVSDNPNNSELEHTDYFTDMAVTITIKRGNSSTFQVLLEYFKQVYGNPPIYIHENGLATPHNSSLEDSPRVEYMQGYIGSMLDAIRNGSKTKGYFVWSFVDVFELAFGYQQSYGLYYIDFDDPDLRRYPKLSACWYSNFLKGEIVSSGGHIKLENNSSDMSNKNFI